MRKIFCFSVLAIALNAAAQPPRLKIAYNVLHDTATGNYEIFIMNAEGKDQKNISNYSGLDWVYRTYKDKIYFISTRDTTCKRCYKLYEMKSGGTGIRKISDLVLEDSWMDTHNGVDMIVSARIGREIRSQLFWLNLENGSYSQLTTDTAAYHNDPVLSPNGKQIAFRYKAKRRDRNMKTELYIMNTNGSAMKQLSFYPKDDTTASSGEYHAGPPKWNVKDNFISYISYQKGKYEVYAISPDGKKQWQVTRNEMEPGYHDWTPDGKWLTIDMSPLTGKRGFDIYLMNSKTKKLTRLTDSWKYEQAPVFVE
jgi:TolB protein